MQNSYGVEDKNRNSSFSVKKKRYKIFYKNECLTLSRLRKHLKRKLIKDAQGVFFFFF